MFFPVKVRVAVVGLVLAGGAAAAVALGPAGSAVGQSSPPIQLQLAVNRHATLVAKGAGVDVSVSVSCSGPLVASGGVSVSLTEHVGTEVATGFGSSTQFDCNGGVVQHIDVLAIADAGGKAFDKGSVTVQANLGACEVNGPCASQGIEPTIKIRG